MKVQKKAKCNGIPKHSSHSGFSREQWQDLNAGKVVEMDSIPEAGKAFVDEIKKGK